MRFVGTSYRNYRPIRYQMILGILEHMIYLLKVVLEALQAKIDAFPEIKTSGYVSAFHKLIQQRNFRQVSNDDGKDDLPTEPTSET